MQKNKWILQDIDKDKLFYLQKELALSEIILKILLARGLNSEEEILSFIYPKKEDLFNPFLFRDMYKAVLRIKQSIENQEKILIYADRDVDGITSFSVKPLRLIASIGFFIALIGLGLGIYAIVLAILKMKDLVHRVLF